MNCVIMFLSLYLTDGYETIDATKRVVDPGTCFEYQWKGCGLKLKVPTNALDSNVPSRIRLQTCTTDQFKIPEDMELVSGIYWVDFVGEFANPITIELEHCASLGQTSQFYSLSFISTEGPVQGAVPYKLQSISGGIFPQNSSYGSIQLRQSSAMAVATLGSASKSYRILKYYTPQNTTTWLMHLIIVCDLQIYIKVSYFSLKPIIPCIG